MRSLRSKKTLWKAGRELSGGVDIARIFKNTMNPYEPLLSPAFPCFVTWRTFFHLFPQPDLSRSGQVVFPRSCQCELPEWRLFRSLIKGERPVGSLLWLRFWRLKLPFLGGSRLPTTQNVHRAYVKFTTFYNWHSLQRGESRSTAFSDVTLINFDLAFRWKAVILEWTAQLLLGVQNFASQTYHWQRPEIRI